MPTLENDELVFRFPEIEPDAKVAIRFERTLRIPDTPRAYPLPPTFGAFPLRHVEDYPHTLSMETLRRGGVVLPIWQAEAMWISFDNHGPHHDLDFPVAIKVASGMINAVSGKAWAPGLSCGTQDDLVSPEQPWLDGFASGKGFVRQFVAMPLGEPMPVDGLCCTIDSWGFIS